MGTSYYRSRTNNNNNDNSNYNDDGYIYYTDMIMTAIYLAKVTHLAAPVGGTSTYL